MGDVQTASEPFVLFELAGAHYGVPSRAVRQVEMVEEITPVPNAPSFVEGIVFVRGQVIPTINLRRRFGFETVARDLRTRLIVVSSRGRTGGLLVDSAREFVSIPSGAIQKPPDEIAGLSGKYLEGIALLGERPILILDVDEVLNLRGIQSFVPEGG